MAEKEPVAIRVSGSGTEGGASRPLFSLPFEFLEGGRSGSLLFLVRVINLTRLFPRFQTRTSLLMSSPYAVPGPCQQQES
jgi:hypothetical protein